MQPVAEGHRKIVNIKDAKFKAWESVDGSDSGQSLVQLKTSSPDGVGFHLFRMAPGATTDSHRHTGDEEWFMLDGDLTDNDGTQYVAGDLVWMKEGTEHNSYTENGCTLVVYIEKAEALLTSS